MSKLKNYKIELSKGQLDSLYYEYNVVEEVIDDILKQAKQQGYTKPEDI